MTRSNRPEVRNPLLALPATRRLRALLDINPDLRRELRILLIEMKAQAIEKERAAYAKRKGPMTAYWMAAGAYFKHLAGALK